MRRTICVNEGTKNIILIFCIIIKHSTSLDIKANGQWYQTVLSPVEIMSFWI